MVVFRKFICFSTILLKRVTSLLLFTVYRLCEGSTRWRWSCSDAHLCPWGLMCREESTVAIFCEILHLIFGIQQGQLGNLQNMLFLGCLFRECLYLTIFFTLTNDQIDNFAAFPLQKLLLLSDMGAKFVYLLFCLFLYPQFIGTCVVHFLQICHFFELGITLNDRSLWLHDMDFLFGFFNLHLQSCCNAWLNSCFFFI